MACLNESHRITLDNDLHTLADVTATDADSASQRMAVGETDSDDDIQTANTDASYSGRHSSSSILTTLHSPTVVCIYPRLTHV